MAIVPAPQSFEWETVPLPIRKGVDLFSRTRMTDSEYLTAAVDVYFPKEGGVEMRRGHVAKPVVSFDAVPVGDKPDDTLFGWGLLTSPSTHTSSYAAGNFSTWPDAGPIRGLFTDNNTVVAWNGWRAYLNNHNDEFSVVNNAVLPSCKTFNIAKSSASQLYSDAADNGVIRVVATRELDPSLADYRAFAYVYSSTTDALLFRVQLEHGGTDPLYIRTVPLTDCVYIFANDTGLNTVECWRIDNDDYYTSFPSGQRVSIGTSTSAWDVYKVNDNLLIIAVVNAGTVRLTQMTAAGVITSNFAAALSVNLDGEVATNVSIAQHPVSFDICVFWYDSAKQDCFSRIYAPAGTPLFAKQTVANYSGAHGVIHMTASHVLTLNASGESQFHLFHDTSDLGLNQVTRYNTTAGAASALKATRYGVLLASKAVTVGNLPFVFTISAAPYTIQITYLLMDDLLKPVGVLENGTAHINNYTIPWIPCINRMDEATATDTMNFHGAILYRVRTENTTANAGFVYEEPSTKFYQLDFLPKLKPVSFGGCTYFPGMQLWQFDGRNFLEAGFHLYPEMNAADFNPDSAAGSMTVGGEYHYRIYLCHKNARGEEVRSAAKTFDVNMGGSDTQVIISIRTSPTRRDDAYFLVFRTQPSGEVFNLVSNRDPASTDCPKNTLSAATVTFTDTQSDASILDNELDPANSDVFLEPFSPPASEVIAVGKDRIWLAGGEITPGRVLGSRYSFEFQSATFSPALSFDLDKTDEPIVGINFSSDYMQVFKENSSYIVAGNLSDNSSSSSTVSSQLTLTDTGQTINTPNLRHTFGIFFQSANGVKLVTAAGGIEYVGKRVEPSTTTVNAIIPVTQDAQIRFYQDSDCLVLDYESGEWTTFSCGATDAVVNPLTGLAVLAVESSLWFETADTWADDSVAYGFSIQTAHLQRLLGGFQRVRRVGIIGEEFGSTSPISIYLYYDGSTSVTEQINWDPDDNTSLLAGAVFRIGKQKCSSISVRIAYSGTTKGPAISSLNFEIGNKPGINRIKTTTTSGVMV